MTSYKYTDPIELGYTKFKLTRKQHNLLFKKRKINIFMKCEYYRKDSHIRFDTFDSLLGKIAITLILPLSVITYGVKEVSQDIKKVYKQKKYGSFSSEYISKDSKLYDAITEIIETSKSNELFIRK